LVTDIDAFKREHNKLWSFFLQKGRESFLCAFCRVNH
jgi:hypothetical protein